MYMCACFHFLMVGFMCFPLFKDGELIIDIGRCADRYLKRGFPLDALLIILDVATACVSLFLQGHRSSWKHLMAGLRLLRLAGLVRCIIWRHRPLGREPVQIRSQTFLTQQFTFGVVSEGVFVLKVCGNSTETSRKLSKHIRFIASGKGAEILQKVCGNFAEICFFNDPFPNHPISELLTCLSLRIDYLGWMGSPGRPSKGSGSFYSMESGLNPVKCW